MYCCEEVIEVVAVVGRGGHISDMVMEDDGYGLDTICHLNLDPMPKYD